jgi:IS30 family transposase
MGNQLKMAFIDSIFTLHQRGWSQRRIARELGIHRETVAQYLQQGPPESKPAIAPVGSEAVSAESKPALRPSARQLAPKRQNSHVSAGPAIVSRTGC